MDEVAICNLALSWLGQSALVSLDDEGKPAELCRVNFPASRDAALEDTDWTFASRIVRTTPLVNPENDPRPPYRGEIYAIQPGMLTVRQIDDGSDQWKVKWERMENRVFVHSRGFTSSTSTIYLRGTMRIEDVTKWVATFQQAAAARLSADIAMAITESKNREALAEKRYEEKVARARSSDGRQGTSQRIKSDRLRRVRGGGGIVTTPLAQ